jgi:diadenosine tetraphosphate (Ap4A) HIT family hydrolase
MDFCPLCATGGVEYFKENQGGLDFLLEAAQTQHDATHLVVSRRRTAFLALNRYPCVLGQMMVVPYRKVSDLSELSDAERLELWELAEHGQKLLRKAIAPSGFHIGLNLGECVGVCVAEHLPLHIVPQAPGHSPADQSVLPEAVNELYAQIMLAQKASVALLPLIRVTYVSAACHPFTEAELCELLLHAKTNNSKAGITGLLLYHRMSFFHILEGKEEDVTPLFERLKKDPRHNRVLLLSREVINGRSFDNWEMGFIDLAHAATKIPGFVALLDAKPSFLHLHGDTKLVAKLINGFQDGQWRQSPEDPLEIVPSGEVSL